MKRRRRAGRGEGHSNKEAIKLKKNFGTPREHAGGSEARRGETLRAKRGCWRGRGGGGMSQHQFPPTPALQPYATIRKYVGGLETKPNGGSAKAERGVG